MIRIELPLHSAQTELASQLLAQPKAPVLIEVPESWCYHIQRGSPPGGWRGSLTQRLRAGLFPEPLESLHWDQEFGATGVWDVWGLPQARLEKALGSLSTFLWGSGRRVRIRPAGMGEPAISAFPNLAPESYRARRIPWARIRSLAIRFGPASAASLILGGLGLFAHGRWNVLQARLQQTEQAVQRMERQAQEDRQMLAMLRSQASRKRQDPPWLTDLDAMTRLLPEDTRLVKLEWELQGSQLELMTPHPELIQEILEASPEFKGVRFLGTLDRQGELSRLTLQCESEAAR